MKKGFVFKLHSITGLISGLFILLLSLSGSVLVFHDELDALQTPKINTVENVPLLSTDSCYRKIQKEYPDALISSCSIPQNTSAAFVFTIYDLGYNQGLEPLQVFIHPQTAEILKTRGGSEDMQSNFMSWLAAFHNSFHLHKKGELLLGIFGIAFLISIITGTVLYRKSIIAVLSFRKKAFRWENLHQLIGVYALLFNLVIAITGSWMQRYVFKKDFFTSSAYIPEVKASPFLPFSMSKAFNDIKKQYPGFSEYVIYFAQSNKGSTAVYGSNAANSFIHSKKFADVIFLDSTGKVSNTRFVNEVSAADRYDIINSQVHFGKYGGLPVKIIYSLLGLMSAILSITGALLWIKRKNAYQFTHG